MFGRKKPREVVERGAQTGLPKPDEVPEAHRASAGRYTVIPLTKQLNSGKWIVRLVLEETVEGAPRSYDFLGPIKEYASEEEARLAGIEHARRRLE